MIAEIAAIFHWQLDTCRAFDLDELLHWHGLAVDVWRRMNRIKD